MKSYRQELWFNVPARRAFINITPKVEEALRASGICEGLVLVNAMHITASVFINDDEPGLHHDYDRWLEELAPHEPLSRYRHNLTGEDNGDAHRFFTASSTAAGASGCWSRSSANRVGGAHVMPNEVRHLGVSAPSPLTLFGVT